MVFVLDKLVELAQEAANDWQVAVSDLWRVCSMLRRERTKKRTFDSNALMNGVAVQALPIVSRRGRSEGREMDLRSLHLAAAAVDTRCLQRCVPLMSFVRLCSGLWLCGGGGMGVVVSISGGGRRGSLRQRRILQPPAA